jgi:hypothetical protein
MHRSILAIAASTALIISGPAYAQHGHGGGKPTTSPSTTHGNSGATTHGQSGSHGPATKPTGGGATHGPSAPHGKSGETHGAGSASTKKSSTTTLTPVQQKLQKNTNLADKLKSRLPENTDLMKAAEGFSNLGQFVAAVNVSNNLGLKFTDLRTRMVDDGMSLGQAIQDVKKTSNVETEVKRAETEADAMIKSSTTSTTSSTTSTSSPTTTKKSSKTKTKSHSGEDK